MMKNQQNKK